MSIKTVEFKGDRVIIIDQRKLPLREVYLEIGDAAGVAKAIKEMAVRGAPAIGVAAAAGLALGAAQIRARDPEGFLKRFEKICALMGRTRPTAANLFWAIDRMKRVVEANRNRGPEEIKQLLVEEAFRINEEDIEVNQLMGKVGERFIPDGARVMTHCNAGALACASYGTALGVLRAARDSGKRLSVVATETRPRLQGAKLTCWELLKDGFQVTLIADTMAGHAMKEGLVDLVLVGADRVAANGDVANKIGTYQLALLAHYHGLPFYVAAPLSTLDLLIPSGEAIPIEHRSNREVTHISGKALAPEGVRVLNPAFDVTPARYITAIITERGACQPPSREGLGRLAEGGHDSPWP